MTSKTPASILHLIDTTTVVSLFSTLAILAAAYLVSTYTLPARSSTKIRLLFIWHAFDFLIHSILEAGYLYNCFYSYADTSLSPGLGHLGRGVSEFLAPEVLFLGHKNRVYGSFYGKNPLAALWRVYAKADKRWGGSDLTVISLELLTVFVMGPLALWVCVCLSTRKPGMRGGSEWFWMMIVATGELYGGFMTFAPEWLTGNTNLDSSNWLYLWVYLVFFNCLWVAFPLWILYEAYLVISRPSSVSQTSGARKSQ